MKKLLSLAAATVMVSAAFASSAFATYDYGQIAGGDIYRVRNVSDNQTSFEKTTNADLCETVQFKLRVHNAGPKPVTNVNVKATLSSGVSTSHSSTATISASNNYNNAVASGTAGVNLSKAGSIAYVNGSTELLDNAGNRLSTLGDTILTSGVSLGTVEVSTNNMRFVQFKAKMNCEPPVVKNIEVCELATKKIVTIREDQFDASKHSKNLADCKEVVKHIKVCELATKKLITIDEKSFDAAKHSKTLADCADKPQPGEIVVCETATNKVVTIKENEFDASKHTRDLAKCAEAPVTPVTPVTPTELPRTGATGVIGVVASVIAAAAGYAVTARRNVLG